MKQFLYLDTDIVNSIIAQSEQGLIQTLSNEQLSSNTESNSSDVKTSFDVTIGGSLIKLAKAEADLSGGLESVENGSSTSTSRDIITKTMHDAAFNIAYKYINPIKIDSTNSDLTGSYIEMTRAFDFVDLNYLEGLFEKDGIIDFIKKNAAEKIEAEGEKIKGQYNRTQLRQISNNYKTEIRKAIAVSNKQYEDIAVIIKALRGLIPYNRMLISHDGYLIPLDSNYFRIDPRHMGFKYGGKISCVGIVTNIIGKETDSIDENNMFATLQSTANEALINLLPTSQNNLRVIHPIAIYYGD